NALASAAQDLKTPLAILKGYIELLQSQKLGPLNDRQREVMGDMFSSGQPVETALDNGRTSRTPSKGALPIPARESGRNFTCKSSTISSACLAANRPRAWAWDSPLPAVFSKAWAARSGSKANRARLTSFLFSFP